MLFQNPLLTTKGPLKSTVDALRFIERELAPELRSQSRWSFAEALLKEAERTKKKRDLNAAHRQLKQALQNDHLLRTGHG
jgi:hypothetical protein